MPKLPPSLTLTCNDYILASSALVDEILRVHIENMKRANICKVRHNKLLGAIDKLKESE